MKLKTLASAIAVAGVLASAQNAFAVLTPSSTPNLTLYVSGASAQDQQFRRLFANLCDPASGANGNDQLIYMSRGTGIPNSAQQGFMCRMSSARVPGLPASPGIVVAVYKRSEGGSGFGVGPVASGEAIDFLNPTTCEAAAGATLTENSVVYNIFRNCTGNVERVPNAGISDVEPKIFKGVNLIDPDIPENADIDPGDPGTVALTAAQLNSLVVRPLNVTTFGVPVTLNLYRALQTAQGLNTTDEIEDMPSLSREQIASIMTGGINSWAHLTVNNGGTATQLTAFPGVTAPSSAKIEICRRSSGSGTQAQFNALFLNAPCSDSAVNPVADNTEFTSRQINTIFGDADWTLIGTADGRDGVSPSLPAVHEGQGSGDVDDCLDRLQANNVWGIGVSSLERHGVNRRFIKVNGVAPTLENVAKNNYLDWATGTMQYRTPAAGGPAAGSQTLSILNAIVTETSSPTILNAINQGFLSPSRILQNDGVTKAPVGILALRSSTVNPSAVFTATNPVMTAVREKSGAPDSCATATVRASNTQRTELDVDSSN